MDHIDALFAQMKPLCACPDAKTEEYLDFDDEFFSFLLHLFSCLPKENVLETAGLLLGYQAKDVLFQSAYAFRQGYLAAKQENMV